MDTDQKRVLTWLLGWCAAIVASPVMAGSPGDRFSIVTWIGGHLLFVSSFAALTLSIWQFVRAGRLSRMDAWWWLSIPYSVASPLAIVAFRLKEIVVIGLGLFLLVWFVTTLSSAVWTLVTIVRAVVVPEEEFTATKRLMLGLALLVPLVLFVFFR